MTILAGSWMLAVWKAASSPSAPALAHTAAAQLADVMAAAPDAGSPWDAVTPFLNVGLTGVVLLMLVFRKGIVPEWVLRDAEQRNAQLEAKVLDYENRLRDSTNLMLTQVVPVTNRAVEVTADLLDHLDEERDRRDDARGRGPRGR